MKYYRNYELANTYHVSQSSVGKWVEAARKGKLDLELIQSGDKSYIAATSKNRATIEAMVRERKKYFNTRSLKIVSPKPEFYELFAPDQILDIITNLEVAREIPRQYNYFGEGANNWDKYVMQRVEEESPNAPTLAEAKQLAMNQSYLDALLARYKRVNIIDVGPGNALPIKQFLQHILDSGKLGRYLAIDISPEMLAIAERNIKKWFGDRVSFEADIRDITHERFIDQLAPASFDVFNAEAMNLVLLLGGTLGNFAWPDEVLRVVYHSMGRNDLFVYTLKLDEEKNRHIFDFTANPGALSPNHRLVFDFLNIDDSFYEVETGYDKARSERYSRVRLTVALSIVFEFPEGRRQLDFEKDDTILLWRYKHQTADEVIDQFKANGFNVLQSSQTEDQEFLLVVCNIAPKN